MLRFHRTLVQKDQSVCRDHVLRWYRLVRVWQAAITSYYHSERAAVLRVGARCYRPTSRCSSRA